MQERQKRAEIYMEGEYKWRFSRLFLLQWACQKETFFTNNKASKNAEINRKIISGVTKRSDKRGELYEYTVGQSRSKYKALVSTCKGSAMLRKTSSGT